MNQIDPSRKRRKSHLPKGRQLDEAVLLEVQNALGDRPRKRDLLIEFLHLIQDRNGCLPAAHLRALAEEMKLSQAEVYEVASFYDHFDVVREGEERPAPLTIRVCDSLSCMMAGAENLIAELEQGANPDHVRVLRAPCMGRCATAPAARVGNREVDHGEAGRILEMANEGEFDALVPAYINLYAYQEQGGYQALETVRSGALSFDQLTSVLGDAGLRGLGGAGFPAGKKWGFVKSYPGPRLMTINGDEGEPGTFKDRHYLESDPHRMFEGALIAAHAVEAERIYLYMRDEYPAVLEILRAEIAALEEAELIEPGFIELRRGAGAYICGEESAMIESIEGKRGLPRHRPPYIAEVGLFGRPTLNHNVETLWWLR
ncbi:MAG: NAD(P)H-dependent oxidoreductase subunit E, partial [Ahrensia sp.]